VVTPKYPNVNDNYDFDVVRYSSASVSKNLEYRVGNIVPIKTLTTLLNKDFDLVHVHSPFVSAVVADELVKLNPNIPVVFTYHTKFDIELEKRFKDKLFLKVAKKFILNNINRADEVWVVSKGSIESLKSFGYKGPYRVMRNGTDFKSGVSSEERIKKLKEKHQINDDELVFLFVGRMMWYKNIKLIIDALRLLPADLKFKMIFVGKGNDVKDIENYTKHIGISKKCVFAGAVYDREILRDYYSASDLFLFPSTYDTSGLVVMEAAATALPSVLIKNSCASEGVINNRNGFLCDENEKSLKDVILNAVSNRDKLKEIGINAQKEVYYSWEDSITNAYKRYIEIIDEFKPRDIFGKRKG
ncbi:MAG: glycosyltransferase, partial [Clostridia bacterium]|nr:glycosyltransferase [Clostridia bacterium]